MLTKFDSVLIHRGWIYTRNWSAGQHVECKSSPVALTSSFTPYCSSNCKWKTERWSAHGKSLRPTKCFDGIASAGIKPFWVRRWKQVRKILTLHSYVSQCFFDWLATSRATEPTSQNQEISFSSLVSTFHTYVQNTFMSPNFEETFIFKLVTSSLL